MLRRLRAMPSIGFALFILLPAYPVQAQTGALGKGQPVSPVVFLGDKSPASAVVTGSAMFVASPPSGKSPASIVFKVDGAEVGKVTAKPYKVKWDTTQKPDGKYSLQAVGLSASGEQVWSKELTIQVVNAGARPSTVLPPAAAPPAKPAARPTVAPLPPAAKAAAKPVQTPKAVPPVATAAPASKPQPTPKPPVVSVTPVKTKPMAAAKPVVKKAAVAAKPVAPKVISKAPKAAKTAVAKPSTAPVKTVAKPMAPSKPAGPGPDDWTTFASPNYSFNVEYPAMARLENKSAAMRPKRPGSFWIAFANKAAGNSQYAINVRFCKTNDPCNPDKFAKYNPYLLKWQRVNVNGINGFATTSGNRAAKTIIHRTLLVDDRNVWMLNLTDTTGNDPQVTKEVFSRVVKSFRPGGVAQVKKTPAPAAAKPAAMRKMPSLSPLPPAAGNRPPLPASKRNPPLARPMPPANVPLPPPPATPENSGPDGPPPPSNSEQLPPPQTPENTGPDGPPPATGFESDPAPDEGPTSDPAPPPAPMQ